MVQLFSQSLYSVSSSGGCSARHAVDHNTSPLSTSSANTLRASTHSSDSLKCTLSAISPAWNLRIFNLSVWHLVCISWRSYGRMRLRTIMKPYVHSNDVFIHLRLQYCGRLLHWMLVVFASVSKSYKNVTHFKKNRIWNYFGVLWCWASSGLSLLKRALSFPLPYISRYNDLPRPERVPCLILSMSSTPRS